MTSYTLAEIGKALGAEVVGDGSLRVQGAAEPADAGPGDLAIAAQPKFAEMLPEGGAHCALMAAGADWQSYGLKGAILAGRPRYAMASVTRMIDANWRAGEGIHDTAVIHPGARIGPGAAIGPFTVIAEGVQIGPNARIGAHVTIGPRSRIGAEALIMDGVRIRHDVSIGDRPVLHPNVVLGGDGFSFVTPEPSGAEVVRATLGEENQDKAQPWTRIHSLGGLTVGDDVEMGANCVVDRGTIRDTRIGNGVKMDALVQIGHNVVTGDDCLFCGQVAIAGSTRIGNNVILGGQTGVADNLQVGDRVVTGGATAVLSNVPAGRVMLGYPATSMKSNIESYKALRRLPRILKQLDDWKKSGAKPGGSA